MGADAVELQTSFRAGPFILGRRYFCVMRDASGSNGPSFVEPRGCALRLRQRHAAIDGVGGTNGMAGLFAGEPYRRFGGRPEQPRAAFCSSLALG